MSAGRKHHGPGGYRRCRVCDAAVPLKYEWCDQCNGAEEVYWRLVREFDAVDITEEVTRIEGVKPAEEAP